MRLIQQLAESHAKLTQDDQQLQDYAIMDFLSGAVAVLEQARKLAKCDESGDRLICLKQLEAIFLVEDDGNEAI